MRTYVELVSIEPKPVTQYLTRPVNYRNLKSIFTDEIQISIRHLVDTLLL